MHKDIIEALKPSVGENVLVMVAYAKEDGTLRYTVPPMIKANHGQVRAEITRSVHYSSNMTLCHTAVYKWDVDENAWSLVEYVPQDMHKDELPWRKKKTKS